MAKCKFMQDFVNYLGHIVDREGTCPSTKKAEAISQTKAPRDVKELCAFLGMVNYCGKFIPQLTNALRLLHQLLRKDEKWMWTKACKAVSQSKNS